MNGRVVAVLGYSPRRGADLHPVCAARVARAESVARGGDLVVLSGWSRRTGGKAEAELMARAWHGPPVDMLCDPAARHTAGNAARVAAVACDLGAAELVVVTSWWHRPRTSFLLRRAVGPAELRVTTVGACSPWSLPLLVRELACIVAAPLQLRAIRRAARGRSAAARN